MTPARTSEPRAAAPDLCLAPLKGFTNALFRNLFYRHFGGFDRAMAPFVPTLNAAKVGRAHIRDLLPEINRTLPVTPQVMTNDAESFLRLARCFADLGYESVNWNLGCPFPMVARKIKGSGLLPHPDRIRVFLDRVVPELPLRLSIKIRLGRKRPDEVFSLIDTFNRHPLEEIVIHPRTGVQMYRGEPDLETFGQCLERFDVPVTYNGNLFDVASFDAIRSRFPTVSRWMIGRGALVDPYLPSRIKGRRAAVEDPVARFRRFHDDLFEGYKTLLQGPGHRVDRMKGYWQYFSASFANGRQVFKKIKKARTPSRYGRIVADFLEGDAVWEPSAHRLPG